jgi:hypothetical protein
MAPPRALGRACQPDISGLGETAGLGKRPAVGEAALYSDEESEMVVHATGTIPARRDAVAP